MQIIPNSGGQFSSSYYFPGPRRIKILIRCAVCVWVFLVSRICERHSHKSVLSAIFRQSILLSPPVCLLGCSNDLLLCRTFLYSFFMYIVGFLLSHRDHTCLLSHDHTVVFKTPISTHFCTSRRRLSTTRAHTRTGDDFSPK